MSADMRERSLRAIQESGAVLQRAQLEQERIRTTLERSRAIDKKRQRQRSLLSRVLSR